MGIEPNDSRFTLSRHTQQQHGSTPMNGSSTFSSSCVVHLLHAASGLTLSYVASPDTRVDVGTIAAHFALQPNSLHLNGHFISRDSHFISGLTWRPLLSFFHSRGLNSGTDACNPVEVQGFPLLQLPVEGVITSKLAESLAFHEKPQNAKRKAGESNLVSPFKRSKPERDSDGIPCKLKRGRFEDDDTSCIWNKRVRLEVNSGAQQGTDEFQLYKDDVISGFKRQESLDDISIERRLWKRVKEVKV